MWTSRPETSDETFCCWCSHTVSVWISQFSSPRNTHNLPLWGGVTMLVNCSVLICATESYRTGSMWTVNVKLQWLGNMISVCLVHLKLWLLWKPGGCCHQQIVILRSYSFIQGNVKLYKCAQLCVSKVSNCNKGTYIYIWYRGS